MRRLALIVAALVAAAIGCSVAWTRNRRLGAGRMNAVVNPFLVRRGIAGAGTSEIGTLEHIGRRSGVRRLTPVHPVTTGDGFRFVVPLGLRSEWAQNVLAAGHCRLQLRDVVYELDEPVFLPAGLTDGIGSMPRLVGGLLGFMYLRLHRFSEAPGTLEPVELAPAAEPPATSEHADRPDAEPAGLAGAPA